MNFLRYAVAFMLLSGRAMPQVFADTTSTDTPVASVGGQILTDKQMQAEIGAQLYEAQKNIYEVKKNWAMQKAKAALFAQAAKEAGMTVEGWKAKEITSQVPPPSQTDIDAASKQYFKGSPTPEQMTQLKQYLSSQQLAQREEMVYQQLAAKTPVQIFLQKPEAPHIVVTYAADDPYKGKKDAPITIVEFTDFQCPYCKQSQATIKQVEDTYKDQVKLVTRLYPLPFHNRAKPAAEAAMCAKEQGKYWEYRDKLFADQKLEDADLQTYAQQLDLKMKKFNECLAANRYESRIASDIADGQRFGVQGTPHFFINGESISGAQPFSAFKEIIDADLAKAGATTTTKS